MSIQRFYLMTLAALLIMGSANASDALSDEQFEELMRSGVFSENKPKTDGDLALALQFQEEDRALASHIREQSNIDLEMARQLQLEDDRAFAQQQQGGMETVVPVDIFNMYEINRTMTAEVRRQLDAICETMRLVATASNQPKGLDVHVYNAHLRPYAPLLTSLNQQMGLNPNSTLDDCMRRLRVLRGELGVEMANYAEAELNQLAAYLRVNVVVEPETGMHPLQLLSCLVDFLEKSDLQANDVGMFFDCLDENSRLDEKTKTKGGCYSGYIGRMVRCNANFVLRLLCNIMITSAE